MYVCVCNGITERQVRQAIEQGAASLSDLTEKLGVAAGCGSCAGFTEELLRSFPTLQAVTLAHAA